MSAEPPRLTVIISIFLSAVVAVVAFFSHISSLDQAQRGAIDSLNVHTTERFAADVRERAANYSHIIGRLAALEATVSSIDEVLDRLDEVMLQEYGDLLRDKHRRVEPEKLGENGE